MLETGLGRGETAPNTDTSPPLGSATNPGLLVPQPDSACMGGPSRPPGLIDLTASPFGAEAPGAVVWYITWRTPSLVLATARFGNDPTPSAITRVNFGAGEASPAGGPISAGALARASVKSPTDTAGREPPRLHHRFLIRHLRSGQCRRHHGGIGGVTPAADATARLISPAAGGRVICAPWRLSCPTRLPSGRRQASDDGAAAPYPHGEFTMPIGAGEPDRGGSQRCCGRF
jgi:hypothetical protein